MLQEMHKFVNNFVADFSEDRSDWRRYRKLNRKTKKLQLPKRVHNRIAEPDGSLPDEFRHGSDSRTCDSKGEFGHHFQSRKSRLLRWRKVDECKDCGRVERIMSIDTDPDPLRRKF